MSSCSSGERRLADSLPQCVGAYGQGRSAYNTDQSYSMLLACHIPDLALTSTSSQSVADATAWTSLWLSSMHLEAVGAWTTSGLGGRRHVTQG